MKLIGLFVIILPLLFLVETKDTAFKVGYNLTYKPYQNSDEVKEEEFLLHYKNGKTIFQSEKSMRLDTMLVKEIYGSKILPKFVISIITDNEKIYFRDLIWLDVYKYEEVIAFKWQLTSERKKIGNYTCRKATTYYSGREWTAWYTMDIPISAGPYKFKGLPGLIVRCEDATSSFLFEATNVAKSNVAKLEKYDPQNDFRHINTTRKDYNMQKITFEKNMLAKSSSNGSFSDQQITFTPSNTNTQTRDPKGQKILIYNPIELN